MESEKKICTNFLGIIQSDDFTILKFSIPICSYQMGIQWTFFFNAFMLNYQM